MSGLPADLLAILVCPRCRGALTPETEGVRCDACRISFPVTDGVPNLLLPKPTATREPRR